MPMHTPREQLRNRMAVSGGVGTKPAFGGGNALASGNAMHFDMGSTQQGGTVSAQSPVTTTLPGGGTAPPANDPFANTPNVGGAFSGGDDPLGGPRGVGTAGDPLFGSGGSAEELPGGREGGYQFRATPGYNFRLQQAQQAVENSAASRGGLLSGNTLKDLTRFSQGLAEEEFQNVFNMLGNLRNPGATQTMSSAAQQFGANAGNALANQGAARAQGIVGGNRSMQEGIGGALGILGSSGIFDNNDDQLFPGGASAEAGGFFGGGLGA